MLQERLLLLEEFGFPWRQFFGLVLKPPPLRTVCSWGREHSFTGWLCCSCCNTWCGNQHRQTSANLDLSFHSGYLYESLTWRLTCDKCDAVTTNTTAVWCFGSEGILEQARLYVDTQAHHYLSLWKLAESLFQTVLTPQNMKKMSKYFFPTCLSTIFRWVVNREHIFVTLRRAIHSRWRLRCEVTGWKKKSGFPLFKKNQICGKMKVSPAQAKECPWIFYNHF